jgi:hypothetical protein
MKNYISIKNENFIIFLMGAVMLVLAIITAPIFADLIVGFAEYIGR